MSKPSLFLPDYIEHSTFWEGSQGRNGLTNSIFPLNVKVEVIATVMICEAPKRYTRYCYIIYSSYEFPDMSSLILS